MSNVLTQTIVYLLLLFIGYGFKKAGIFKVEDSDFLKSVLLYITMPAAAVNGLKDLELQTSFLWCFLIGFATCSLLMAVGMFVSRKSDASGKLLYLFSFNSFNVGNFAIPFLTGLISANGFAAICLFDISVAIFLYGVDYSVAEGIKGEGGGFSLRYVTVLVVAVCAAMFVPFPDDIRQAVCVLLMAPVASVAPLLTVNAGGDGAKAAQVNSISILAGIVMMMAVYALV